VDGGAIPREEQRQCARSRQIDRRLEKYATFFIGVPCVGKAAAQRDRARFYKGTQPRR
jgi:hypothetical protein